MTFGALFLELFGNDWKLFWKSIAETLDRPLNPRQFPPPPPQGFDPLPTQRVPICTILRYPFLVMDLKNFLKAPLASMYTNFEEGSARRKQNAIFWSKFPKKCLKTLFLACFSKFCLQRRKFGQNRDKTVLWESSKNQFGRPKKRSTKFSKFYWKSASPLEKILDPPLRQLICFSNWIEASYNANNADMLKWGFRALPKHCFVPIDTEYIYIFFLTPRWKGFFWRFKLLSHFNWI